MMMMMGVVMLVRGAGGAEIFDSAWAPTGDGLDGLPHTGECEEAVISGGAMSIGQGFCGSAGNPDCHFNGQDERSQIYCATPDAIVGVDTT